MKIQLEIEPNQEGLQDLRFLLGMLENMAYTLSRYEVRIVPVEGEELLSGALRDLGYEKRH
jgi:hypothetical protein